MSTNPCGSLNALRHPAVAWSPGWLWVLWMSCARLNAILSGHPVWSCQRSQHQMSQPHWSRSHAMQSNQWHALVPLFIHSSVPLFIHSSVPLFILFIDSVPLFIHSSTSLRYQEEKQTMSTISMYTFVFVYVELPHCVPELWAAVAARRLTSLPHQWLRSAVPVVGTLVSDQFRKWHCTSNAKLLYRLCRTTAPRAVQNDEQASGQPGRNHRVVHEAPIGDQMFEDSIEDYDTGRSSWGIALESSDLLQGWLWMPG